MLKDPIANNALKCEEFNLKSKRHGNLFAAYANQEVTDYFNFCDYEGVQNKSSEQLSVMQEVEAHQVQEVSLINDFDLELIGETMDLDQFEQFQIAKSLYTFKHDIKVDRSDFGQMQKEGRKREQKCKLEKGEDLQQEDVLSFLGSAIDDQSTQATTQQDFSPQEDNKSKAQTNLKHFRVIQNYHNPIKRD